MRLLWTAGDRMILFGFGREKLPEMNGLYLIAKPVRKGRPAALPDCNLPGSPAGRKFIVCRSQTLR